MMNEHENNQHKTKQKKIIIKMFFFLFLVLTLKYSPSGFHHFLGDIVQEVPATEGKGGLKEGQSNLTNRGRPVHRKGHLRSQALVVP